MWQQYQIESSLLMKSGRFKYVFMGAMGAVAIIVGVLYLAVSAVELRKLDFRDHDY